MGHILRFNVFSILAKKECFHAKTFKKSKRKKRKSNLLMEKSSHLHLLHDTSQRTSESFRA